MSVPSSNAGPLTSAERWQLWEQRGRDNDARRSVLVGRFLWSGASVAAVLLALALLT